MTILWADFYAVWFVKKKQDFIDNLLQTRATEIKLNFHLQGLGNVNNLMSDLNRFPAGSYTKMHKLSWQNAILQRVATRILEAFTCLKHIEIVKPKKPRGESPFQTTW